MLPCQYSVKYWRLDRWGCRSRSLTRRANHLWHQFKVPLISLFRLIPFIFFYIVNTLLFQMTRLNFALFLTCNWYRCSLVPCSEQCLFCSHALCNACPSCFGVANVRTMRHTPLLIYPPFSHFHDCASCISIPFCFKYPHTYRKYSITHSLTKHNYSCAQVSMFLKTLMLCSC